MTINVGIETKEGWVYMLTRNPEPLTAEDESAIINIVEYVRSIEQRLVAACEIIVQLATTEVSADEKAEAAKVAQDTITELYQEDENEDI